MLASATPEIEAVRFAYADSLEKYMSGAALQRTAVPPAAALEESFFLGLRLTRGVSLPELSTRFGKGAIAQVHATIAQLLEDGLMQRREEFVALTAGGRLLSNEVFERFILAEAAAVDSR
jgi:oxygen-independent coproporphyrinogen-3 oxidase